MDHHGKSSSIELGSVRERSRIMSSLTAAGVGVGVARLSVEGGKSEHGLIGDRSTAQEPLNVHGNQDHVGPRHHAPGGLRWAKDALFTAWDSGITCSLVSAFVHANNTLLVKLLDGRVPTSEISVGLQSGTRPT